MATTFFCAFDTFSQPNIISVNNPRRLILFPDNNTFLINSSNSMSVWSLNQNKLLFREDIDISSVNPIFLDKEAKDYVIYYSGFNRIDTNQCFIGKINLTSKKQEFFFEPYQMRDFVKSSFENRFFFISHTLEEYNNVEKKFTVLDFPKNTLGGFSAIARTHKNKIAVVSERGHLLLMDFEGNKILKTVQFTSSTFGDFEKNILAVSNQNNYLATYDREKVTIWNSESLEKYREHKVNVLDIWAEDTFVKFSKDGLYYAIANHVLSKIDIYKSDSGQKVRTISYKGRFIDFEVASNLNFLLFLMEDGEVKKIIPENIIDLSPSERNTKALLSENYLYLNTSNYQLKKIDIRNNKLLNVFQTGYDNYIFQKSLNPNELVTKIPNENNFYHFKFNNSKPTVDIIRTPESGSGKRLFTFLNMAVTEKVEMLFSDKILKRINVKTGQLIDSITIEGESYWDRVIFSKEQNKLFLLNKNWGIAKIQDGQQPIMILDKINMILEDDFDRNLVKIDSDSISIFDLDSEKNILNIPNYLFKHLLNPASITLKLSKNNNYGVIGENYFYGIVAIYDLKNFKILKKFEDPRIINVFFTKEDKIVVVYKNHFEIHPIN
ncbi:hypothetical protein EGI26_15855 [Lacihabitans sp. CCS-44]|nr:hypothetical protein [Lacihabitans sp. CCS-44]